jgi:hypothetical protein
MARMMTARSKEKAIGPMVGRGENGPTRPWPIVAGVRRSHSGKKRRLTCGHRNHGPELATDKDSESQRFQCAAAPMSWRWTSPKMAIGTLSHSQMIATRAFDCGMFLRCFD